MPDFSVALNRKFYPTFEDTIESDDYGSHVGSVANFPHCLVF